jgi:hypothetical protein
MVMVLWSCEVQIGGYHSPRRISVLKCLASLESSRLVLDSFGHPQLLSSPYRLAELAAKQSVLPPWELGHHVGVLCLMLIPEFEA